ncbi:unnamed protein product [Ectocarpus sp. 4 AP-2014]
MPSSRSRCRNLCAAPCGPKPVWNVTLPERSLPPISLQPASTRTRPEFSRVCCSSALGRRCTPLAPVGVRFQGLACSGESSRSRFSRLCRDLALTCSWSPSNPPAQHADTLRARPAARRLVVGQKARGAVVWGWFCWAAVRCVCWGFAATSREEPFKRAFRCGWNAGSSATRRGEKLWGWVRGAAGGGGQNSRGGTIHHLMGAANPWDGHVSYLIVLRTRTIPPHYFCRRVFCASFVGRSLPRCRSSYGRGGLVSVNNLACICSLQKFVLGCFLGAPMVPGRGWWQQNVCFCRFWPGRLTFRKRGGVVVVSFFHKVWCRLFGQRGFLAKKSL